MLSKVDWNLFWSATWARQKVPLLLRRKYWFSFVRALADHVGLHYRRVLWLLRTENGEIGGLSHQHALIAGLPHHVCTPWLLSWCHEFWETQGPLVLRRGVRVKHGAPVLTWEKLSRDCGSSRMRIYDPSMNALDYSSPDGEEGSVSSYSSVNGANSYETRKFGEAQSVEWSLSLVRLLGRQRRYGCSAMSIQSRQREVGDLSPKTIARGKSGPTCAVNDALAITEPTKLNYSKAVTSSIRSRKTLWSEKEPGIFHAINT